MAAHRYWRVRFLTDSQSLGSASLSEIEFRSSLGGANATGGGVVIQTSGTGANAFDGNTNTEWVNSFFDPLPQSVGYDFGVGNDIDIAEVAITSGASVLSAPFTFDVERSDNGISWAIELSVLGQTGWTALEQRLFALAAAVDPLIANFSLPVQHAVVQNTALFQLPVYHSVYSLVSLSLPVKHVVQADSPGRSWRLVIILDGVDVSARLLGVVDIEGNAGAARLAHFTLQPLLGLIGSEEWVKKTVEITYETLESGIVKTSHRRYTGFVNDATYDPLLLVTTFECSDFLQDSFEGKDFGLIDELVGGDYSSAIFNETDNGWEYAQQRLESQAAYYDKDVNGVGRKWSWDVSGLPVATYDDSSIIDDSLGVTLNAARDIVNSVNISFQYRFPRKWQRELNIRWAYPFSMAAYLSNSTTIPTRDMFLQSIPPDWWVKSLYFTKMPPTGSYLDINSTLTAFSISEEIRDSLIWGVSGFIAKRWVQDVVEEYSLTVKSQASIDKFGVVNSDVKYSLDSLSGDDFEDIAVSGIDASSVTANVDSYASPDYVSPLSGAVKADDDYYLDPVARDDFNNAITTALNIAQVDVLRSHRANEISFEGLIDASLDIGVTVQITTTEVAAKGIIGQLKEVYDTASGAAEFEVSVNVYAPDVIGQLSSSIAVPDAPNLTPVTDAVSITLNTYIGNVGANQPQPNWTGYLGNFTYGSPNSQNAVDIENTPAGLVKFPIEFRTTVPPVADGRRDETTFNVAQTYHVKIPENTLTIMAI